MVQPVVPAEVDWRGQYVLGAAASRAPESFERSAVGGVDLAVAPGVPRHPVVSHDGCTEGVVLGWLVDAEAHRVHDGPLALSGPWDEVEADLFRHGGSWIAFVGPGSARPGARAYLDADGTLPLVRLRSGGSAASSSGLLLDRQEYVADFDADLFAHLDVRREGWFPAGLTAHRSVERVLCNHYLDLDTWQPRRHWPGEPVETSTDPEAVTAELMRLAAGATDAIRHAGATAASLTAGNETRFLLAACRPFVHELDFFTLAPLRGSSVDVDVARELARRFGLHHRIVDPHPATRAEQAEWVYLGGHCVTGPNVVAHPSLRALREHDTLLIGLGGEIGRAFFWKGSDTPETRVDARTICGRFGMPASPRVEDATAAWLRGVPEGDAYSVLDLAYLELRMSAWGYANPFGSGKEIVHLAPLVSRRCYELLLSLPPEWKRGTEFVHHAVRRGWPELGELPINRYGDRRDLWSTARRALREPHLVVKKLRKRLR